MPATKPQFLSLLDDFQDSDSEKTIPLPKIGSWPESTHLLDKKSALAIVAAVSAGRPLLVKGEPGCGKSHFARAAAQVLERHSISSVIQPHSEYEELLWTVDYTARLGDAQFMGAMSEAQLNEYLGEKASECKAATKKPLDKANYTSPGPLWWAYGWQSASAQPCKEYEPEPEAEYKALDNGLVLLLDEIDKADLSLTNGLLEVLGNGGFRIPHLDITTTSQVPPLVIMTSNNTRELPKAFLRRCVVLDITLPEGEALKEYFIQLGKQHFPDLAVDAAKQATKLILADREATKADGNRQVKTGLAELIDLLRALNQMPQSQQLEACNQLAQYFFKHER